MTLDRWTYIHAAVALLLAVPAAVVAGPFPRLSYAAGLVAVAGVFGVLSFPLLYRALGLRGRARPADHVTTARVALIAGAAFLQAAGDVLFGIPQLLVAGVVALALLTDAVDGVLARRGGSTAAGGRWDMEADAWAMFTLSVMLVLSRGYPAWILLIGVLRYLFVFVFLPLPELGSDAPPRVFGLLAKSACAVAVVTLLAGLVPVLPRPLVTAANAAALAALVVSFGWETLLRIGGSKR